MAGVLKRYLRKTYFDPSNPAAFTAVDKLYRQALKDGKHVTRKQVKEFLQSVRAYTVHRPAPKRFKRRKVIVGGINDLQQTDLTDLQSLASENDGYRYLFFCIDVFSKRLWVIPLKDKTQTSTISAMKEVFDSLPRPPYKVEFDRGTEYGLKFKKFLENNHVLWLHPRHKILKAETVERVQKTIKQRLFKYFTYSRSLRYIEILPKIVAGYNHSYHSTLKMAPAEVTKANEKRLWWSMYGHVVKENAKKPKFQKGDRVRIKIDKRVFEKGYIPTFSEAVYYVAKVIKSIPFTYRIADSRGEELPRVYYDQELSRFTDKSEIYYIEKFLETRKVGNRKQYLVRWLGYPPKYDSWIWARDIKHSYKA